ncbi:MAG: sulfatase, partial [Cytophagaceae bacterium]|nr:sulfatase [Cytophagaceae bacterium]
RILTLTCPTPGASLGYRLNDGPWRLYTQPVRIPQLGSLNAKAIRIGFKPSEEITLNSPRQP